MRRTKASRPFQTWSRYSFRKTARSLPRVRGRQLRGARSAARARREQRSARFCLMADCRSGQISDLKAPVPRWLRSVLADFPRTGLSEPATATFLPFNYREYVTLKVASRKAVFAVLNSRLLSPLTGHFCG